VTDSGLNAYQDYTKTTRVFPKEVELPYVALGLTGEAGEFAEKVKKILRGDGELDFEKKEAMAYELGDVLWYLAAAADVIGYTLAEIAGMNVQKLNDRQSRNQIKGSGDAR
jgi:NTP pyrophosphatase (non-canonical NTP hydrolase)